MCILALLGAEGFGVEDGQFATEVNRCVLVAAEEEEETTAEKTIKWDQRGCKLKKDQDVKRKKELPEFIRRKCKTTFPLRYF